MRLRRLLFAPILVAIFAVATACGDNGTTPTAQEQPTFNVTSTPLEQAPTPTWRLLPPPQTPTATIACPGAMTWDQAIQNVGERATVQGPVMGTRYASGSRGQPTFLNVGRDYPDRDRFTVVIWGDTRDNFPFAPEVKYDNRTICVTGLIETFEGVPQIIADTPSDIEIVD